jgi:leucyl aminopeptidase (aminopeptidase T)
VDFIDVSRRLLKDNMGLTSGERLVIVYDETTLRIGESLFLAGCDLGAKAAAIRIPVLARNGMEPDDIVAAVMKAADVVAAPTGASLTHTQARKNACAAGARVATMPRITEDMYFNGPITADYAVVEAVTKRYAKMLDAAETAEIRTKGCSLTMSLAGRDGHPSTGVYRNRGESGNLPSGEAYIAPVEGTASGSVLIDGSFVGLGVLDEPLRLTFEGGLLVNAEGKGAAALLRQLGDAPEARNLAELGIGTNDKARFTGVILEDEKIYGTVHIALGSNDTFGGTVAAGIHVDGVMRKPMLLLDGRIVVADGLLKVE